MHVTGPNKPVHKLNAVPTAEPAVLLIGKCEPPNDDGATAKPEAVEVSPEVSSIPEHRRLWIQQKRKRKPRKSPACRSKSRKR